MKTVLSLLYYKPVIEHTDCVQLNIYFNNLLYIIINNIITIVVIIIIINLITKLQIVTNSYLTNIYFLLDRKPSHQMFPLEISIKITRSQNNIIQPKKKN